jgi:hypothetical protein
MKKFYSYYLCLLVFIAFSHQLTAQNRLSDSPFGGIISQYLNQNKERFDLSDNDLSDLFVNNEVYAENTKTYHLYVNQRYNGIIIHNAISSVAIKDNRVFYYANNLLKNINQKINTVIPQLNAQQAIHRVALHHNLGSVQNLELLNSSENTYLYSKGNISQENIPVKLVFFPVSDSELRLAWDLSILTKDGKHWWSIRIDALNGSILESTDWVVSCSFGEKGHSNHENNNFSKLKKAESFNMLKTNSFLMADGSQYNILPLPAQTPDDGVIQLVSAPASPLASPYGWHDDDGNDGAEYTTTIGNNVIAQEDVDGGNGTGYSPDGTASLNFNFPVDFLTQQPIDYQDAAITNLFYINNMMHDIWYHHGFDENAGNFQTNNYRRGSAAGVGDAVLADAQDGGGFNNANFATPPDGTAPRMQMYLFDTFSSPPITINGGSLAGIYGGTPAGFGGPYPDSAPIVSDVVLVEDDNSGGTSTDTNDACDVIINSGSISGKVAILRRGDCEFGVKVLAAENAGAIAAIIVNNVSDPATIVMGPGAVGDSVTIPSLMITQALGEAIIAELNNSNTVNVTLASTVDLRDGDFSNLVVSHEYGHGISNRLTGGPSAVNCLQNPEQMGEGWSDWFALMITMKPGDLPETPRTVFNYLLPGGQNFDRRAPYSTDFGVNNYTYNDSNDNSISPTGGPWNDIPHSVGFYWSTMLWDLTWAYVDKYGFDPDLFNGTGGNNKVMDLVIKGLQLQPCSPGMVDGRDALLAADTALTGGEDQCMIWEVFAARGLGFGSNQGSSASMTDQVSTTALPPPEDPSLANCTTLSTQEINSNNFVIYPNPTKDKLYLKTNKSLGNVALILSDINGRLVLSQKVNLFGEVELNVSNLQSGLYILNIKGNNFETNEKIIIN